MRFIKCYLQYFQQCIFSQVKHTMRDCPMLILLLILQFSVINCSLDDILVKTSKGLLRGYRGGPKRHQINIFKGIPFSKPPVGKFRFRKPEDIEPWDGVLNATHYQAACMSGSAFTSLPQKKIGENCLYLNIFADPACKHSDCAVVFYIHGGSFYFQSAVMFNEDSIAERYASHRIIFVIPAYRIGIFGFISIGDGSAAPKNLGFHDLLKALKWVHEEISNFGGDPNRVTIMGHSGGATAVQILNLSPEIPDELFQQGISLSSADLYRKNLSNTMTMEIAYRSKCASRNASFKEDQVVECLRTKPAVELIRYQKSLTDAEFVDLMFGPEPDGELFTADTIERLQRRSRRRMLLGITKKELSMTRFSSTVPNECKTFTGVFGYRTDEVINACKRQYSYKNGKLSVMRDETRASLFRMASKLTSNNASVYLYSFEMPHHDAHGGDLNFGLGTHLQPNMTNDEITMNHIYPQFIRNFVTEGKPDQKWSRFDPRRSNYKWISYETLANGSTLEPHMKYGFYPKEVNLWMHNFGFVEFKSLELHGAASAEYAFRTAEMIQLRGWNKSIRNRTEQMAAESSNLTMEETVPYLMEEDKSVQNRTEQKAAESSNLTTERTFLYLIEKQQSDSAERLVFRNAKKEDTVASDDAEAYADVKAHAVRQQTNFWVTIGFISAIVLVAVILLIIHIWNKIMIRRRRSSSLSDERTRILTSLNGKRYTLDDDGTQLKVF